LPEIRSAVFPIASKAANNCDCDRPDEAGSNSRCCDLCFVGKLCGDYEVRRIKQRICLGNFCQSESIMSGSLLLTIAMLKGPPARAWSGSRESASIPLKMVLFGTPSALSLQGGVAF